MMAAREQHEVGARQPAQKSRRILGRHGGDASVRQRFDDEDDQHEQRPQQHHGVHPPTRRCGETVPEIEPPSHPESGRARQRNGEAHLRREALLDRLEQIPTLFRISAGSCERQRNERDEGDAADPVDDEQDMQGPSQFDIVDHARLTCCRAPGSAAGTIAPDQRPFFRLII